MVSTLAGPAKGASASSYRLSIDAAAEAEGLALQWFEDELDQPAPRTAIDLARDEAAEAERRGLPLTRPRTPYARMAAVRRWLEIVDAIEAGRPIPASRMHITTREEKIEREKRRPAPGAKAVHPKIIAKASILKARLRKGMLATLEASAIVDVAYAAKISGMAQRTMFKIVARSEIPTVPVFQTSGVRRCIQVAALRQYIQTAVSVA